MTIKIGDKIPSVTLKILGENGPEEITTNEIFDNKKIVLFALPGAFTPTCSSTHLPGFVASADKIKAKGVDSIVCLSVNDHFVMDAWGKAQNAEDIVMLPDGVGALTKAMGMDIDLVPRGLGIRSRRYAMIVDNGVVTDIKLEEDTKLENSSAEKILAAL